MKMFEYKTILLRNDEFEHGGSELVERKLDHYGEHGWELVSSETIMRLGGSPYSLLGFRQQILLILKREKGEKV